MADFDLVADFATSSVFVARHGSRFFSRGGVLRFTESLRSLSWGLFHNLSDPDQDDQMMQTGSISLDLCSKIDGLLALRQRPNAPSKFKYPPIKPS